MQTHHAMQHVALSLVSFMLIPHFSDPSHDLPPPTRNHWCEFTKLQKFRQLIKYDFYNASYLFTWDVFAMQFGNALGDVPLYFLMLILLEIKHVITPSRLKRVSCKPV